MGSKGSSSSSFTPPPEVVEAYKEALGYGRAAMGQQYQPYTGEITAPLTPTQESGIYNVNRAVGTAIPYFGQATGLTADVAGRQITPQQFSQEAIQQYQSPYTQAVANATFANLREQQKQEQEGLQSGAIRAGAFGGDRAGIAAANLARQQELATAQAMSNIYNQGYGQAVGLFGQQQGVNLQADQANAARQLQAAQQLAGLGTGLQGSVLQGAQAQLAAGAQQQAVQQAINSGYYNQYLGAQAYPYQQAQFFANLATGVGGQMGGTTTGTPAQPSPVGSIFGALGALGSIMSDKRAKENIRPIGKTNDGQTIYRFNYKGDDVTQIGLLAQEVEKKHPEAVTTINGLKGVDYKEATDDSVRSMGGGVVPSSTRHNFAAGGPSINDEEDPMIPYKAGVPSKVLQIPKLAKIGGTKPNFGGEPPKQPGGGPSEKDFKGAASGLGAVYNKLTTPTAAESAQKILDNSDDFMSAISNLSFALGGAAARPRFQDGEDVPVTEETKTVSLGDVKPSKDDSDLPPAFRKGEIAPAADAEGTPAGGLVPRPDIPLPPESSARPRDLSYPLLRREEGFVPNAFWDVNAPRHGYSSDTKTSPEGVVTRVQRGDTTTRDEAEHDLTRRVVEGQQWIKSQIGEENWDRLSPQAKAAMTSIRYQYGQYPKSVLVAAMTGDEGVLAKAIETAPSPTPDRMKRQAGLVRGEEQNLGIHEPGGERYLKGGLGIAGGGGGKRSASAEASVAATTGDRKWNLGMAGEGKRSIIESIMDRDFDPIQKRALFSFFAGMAASPSPWFGQQLGAGMQAASNVYNESLNKQAELDVRKAQLGMEEQRIGVSKEQVEVSRQNAARQLLASMTDTIRKYQMAGVPLPDHLVKLFKEAGIAAPATGGLAPPAGGGQPAPGGVVPAPKAPATEAPSAPAAPKAPALPQPEGGTVPAPAPAPAKPERRAEAESEATVQPASVQQIYAPEGTPEAEKNSVWARMPDSKNPEYWESMKKQDPMGFDYYEGRRKAAEEALQKDQGFRDKDGNFVRLPAYEQKLEQERKQALTTKKQEKYLDENMKHFETVAGQVRSRQELDSRIRNIEQLLTTYESGAFAQEKAQIQGALRSIGFDKETIQTATANSEEFEKFMKDQTSNSFTQIQGLGLGQRFTNLELQTAQNAQANPGMQPEANRAILGYTKGINAWMNKRDADAIKEADRVGYENFNRTKFELDWANKPENNINKFVDEAKKNVAVRGGTPNNARELIPGQSYILEPGQHRSQKLQRAKFIGLETDTSGQTVPKFKRETLQ